MKDVHVFGTKLVPDPQLQFGHPDHPTPPPDPGNHTVFGGSEPNLSETERIWMRE